MRVVQPVPSGNEPFIPTCISRLVSADEQNRDAQLKSLLTLETAVEKSKLFSILSYSGFPMSAQPIVDGIRAKLAEAPRLSAVPRIPR